MSHFVFIVFNDPEVVGVLNFLAEALNGRRWRQPPHLTIQGPLPNRPGADALRAIEEKLKDDQLLIANPGLFETKRGVALYLRVQSENLIRVWNKPDFPVEKYGFEPHLTLYEGPDRERALSAHAFLRSGRHRIEMICRDFKVVPYASKQAELFPMLGSVGALDAVQGLISRGKVGSSFRAAFFAAINTDSQST